MDILINIQRHVIVNDMFDVGNIQSSSSHWGGNQDGSTTWLERPQSTLSLRLAAIPMNTGTSKTLLI